MKCCLYFLFALNTLAVFSQEPMQYWNKGEQYLNDQASLVINQAYKVLDAYSPTPAPTDERRLALFAIDALLHDTRLDGSQAFMDYISMAVNRIAVGLENKPTDDARIYRCYNHGFIVQTPTVTIAIDLIRGGSKDHPFMTDEQVQRLVKQCDILFVTHAHSDHADATVARMFCEQGKPVIVPENFWNDISQCVKVLRGSEMVMDKIALKGGAVNLTVSAFPGHQDEMLNNVYAITTPEGLTLMHTGDQSNSNDMRWVAEIHKQVKVDVLLAHCWWMPMKQVVDGIRPTLLITGHENEMEHTIDHREAYWLTFRRLSDVEVPYVVMAWGEHYELKKIK